MGTSVLRHCAAAVFVVIRVCFLLLVLITALEMNMEENSATETNMKEYPTTGNSSGPQKQSPNVCKSDVENSDASSVEFESMKYKINNVDAEKILRLLEDAITKVEVIGYMEYLRNSKSEESDLTQEEVDAVSIFCDLEEQAFSDYRSCLKNKQSLSDFDAFMKLACSLYFKSQDLYSLDLHPSELGDFCSNLRKFEEVVIERFSKTPEEVKEEQNVLKDLKKQVDDLSKVAGTLNAELEDSKNQKKAIEEDYKHIKSALQLEINRIEWLATDKMDTNVKQASDAVKKTAEVGQAVVMNLEQQVANMKGEFTECMHKNLEDEMMYRRKRRETQDKITEMIKKYDVEMGYRQSKYEYLFKEYMDELEKEKLLGIQVVELKKVYDVIMEEMQKKEAERERLEAELQTKSSAALVIQKNWRGYRTRKMLIGGEKKDKGKKSGKKSKKK